jgi:hypothetical protein
MTMTRKIVTVLFSILLVAAAVPGVVADDQCQTIYEIICETDNLQNFCGLIGGTDTENVFEDRKGLTVFAPTNAAVTSMDFFSALDDEKLREVDGVRKGQSHDLRWVRTHFPKGGRQFGREKTRVRINRHRSVQWCYSHGEYGDAPRWLRGIRGGIRETECKRKQEFIRHTPSTI